MIFLSLFLCDFSPASKERIKEKNLLKKLNDRLACYIERALHLESENSRIKIKVSILKISFSIFQILESRKFLYHFAFSYSLSIITKRTETVGDAFKCDHFREIKDGFEHELDTLNAQAADCAKENETLKGDICALQCRLDSATKQRQKAVDDAKILCEQLREEQKRRIIERKEICDRIKDRNGKITTEITIGYDSKLHMVLTGLRNQFKDKVCIAGVDIIDRIIESPPSLDWVAEAEKAKTEIEIKIEVKIKLISELQEDLSKCSSERSKLRITIGRKQREHEKNIAKIRRMQQELIALLNQYQDLINIKLLLDFELAAYNQMLAIEEYRFNIADMCDDDPTDLTGHSVKLQLDSQKRKISTDDEENESKRCCND